MRKKYTLIIAILCSLTATGVAQTGTPGQGTKKSCSCGFGSINQLGFVTGENGNYLLLQTINGMHYKTWFTGIGVGLDFYKTRGIPLFLDIRKNILNKPATPFIYVDGGIHFSWPTNKDKTWNGPRDFNNDLYYDLGIGYKVPISKKHFFLLSAGYSVKKITETLRYNGPCTMCYPPPSEEVFEQYNYTLNRLSLKLGWQF